MLKIDLECPRAHRPFAMQYSILKFKEKIFLGISTGYLSTIVLAVISFCYGEVISCNSVMY